MRTWQLLILIFSTWLVTPGLYVTSPQRDTTIAGVVEISGSVPAEGFDYAEVSYAFQESNTTTWFLISRVERVIQDEVLANWDTTTITDGIYQLRLRAYQTDGQFNDVLVNNLSLANYSHAVDSTQSAPGTFVTMTPTIQSAQIDYPTPLPENEMMLRSIQVTNYLFFGLITGVLIMALIGIIALVNSSARK